MTTTIMLAFYVPTAVAALAATFVARRARIDADRAVASALRAQAKATESAGVVLGIHDELVANIRSIERSIARINVESRTTEES